jgi:hypothetical protein
VKPAAEATSKLNKAKRSTTHLNEQFSGAKPGRSGLDR